MPVSSISVPPSLAFVLDRAGDKNGVDFDYLLQTAIRESSLDPNAKARTSSAVGLFQFLEGTWLDVMKSDGGRLGYQRYADAIEETPEGGFAVHDKALRDEILKLREEPQVAADLAAAFTRRNGDYLSDKFGRMPSPGELYISHFLGAKGAARMFEAGLENPDQIAATIFPRQAEANRAIFFENGEARTIRQVYRALVAKHDDAGGSTQQSAFSAQQIAAGENAEAVIPLVPTVPRDVSFRNLFSSGKDSSPQTPLNVPDAKGGGFFVQLYNK